MRSCCSKACRIPLLMKVASETTVDKCVVCKIKLSVLAVDGIYDPCDMDVADSGELFADTDTGKESTIA